MFSCKNQKDAYPKQTDEHLGLEEIFNKIQSNVGQSDGQEPLAICQDIPRGPEMWSIACDCQAINHAEIFASNRQ